MVLDEFRWWIEDATHLFITLGLFRWKIIETHGCTLHGSVRFHTPFPLRHSLHLPQPENDARAELYDEISLVPVGRPDEADDILWTASSSGSFTFASAWQLFCTQGQQWLWVQLLWHRVIPKSYSFLCWRVLWRRLSTLDRVMVHKPEINQTCRFCVTYDESVDHLFLACDFTREIWRRCCVALHLDFDPTDISLELVVLRLPHLMGTSRGGILARLTLLTWIFSVWEERNARIFYHQSRQPYQVVATIACRVRDIWRAHSHRQDTFVEMLQTWHVNTNMPVFEPPLGIFSHTSCGGICFALVGLLFVCALVLPWRL